jgi:hypothetical protein
MAGADGTDISLLLKRIANPAGTHASAPGNRVMKQSRVPDVDGYDRNAEEKQWQR